MYKVVLSQKADRDIEDIRQYIAGVLLQPVSAEQIISEIYRRLNNLAVSPEGAAIYPYEPWQSREVRCTRVRRYRIFYHVIKRGKEVRIILIAYAGVNPESVAP